MTQLFKDTTQYISQYIFRVNPREETQIFLKNIYSHHSQQKRNNDTTGFKMSNPEDNINYNLVLNRLITTEN